MEGEVIRRLLSGNDTQCFSTAQYADAVDQYIAEQVGRTRESLGMGDVPTEVRRMQLLSIGLVREVAPDVWTLAEGVDIATH
jgi:hypothetical protein